MNTYESEDADLIIKFKKELYSKVALLKAAYSFTDKCYIHLDCDENEYIVELTKKSNEITISEKDFMNEMLSQSLRHEVYLQTKNIREMLTARAMASTLLNVESDEIVNTGSADDILKDWFDNGIDS